jgi:ABC-type Fe3+/spermidine/putrescine transport system ATPase subunit
VSRRFGGVNTVDSFSLALEQGEFVSLLGPSGCGKTTTLRMIAGFLTPTEGTIAMDGAVISSPAPSLPPEKRNMSMIFQSYAIWPNMTAAENVAFGLEVHRLPKAEIRARVDRILDEPLSNLDANLREEMRYEIRRLHDEFHVTTVYVTRDQADAVVTFDRIAVMNQGRVEQVDEPRARYDRPSTRFVAGFIGRTNFLDAEIRGDEVAFDHFAIARERFKEPGGLHGRVSFSLRPQSIHLHGQPPPAPGSARFITGQVVQRAYLGEQWDYTVGPSDSGLLLRVTARPHEMFEVDERV